MYRVEGFVSKYIGRYGNRTVEKFISVICESWEQASQLLQQYKSECVEVDLAIRPVAAARQSRRVRVAL
jgi:hypothetical protein